MKRSSILLAGFLCAALGRIWLRAQTSPNDSAVDELARRTATRIAKAHFDRVLVLTIQGCLLDTNLCGLLDQKIRAELENTIPGVTLLARKDVLPLLSKHGLLPIDGYTGAVEPAAVDLGADVMVTESLTAMEGGYELSVGLTDLTKRTKLDAFSVKLRQPGSDSSAEPIIFREPPDGPALIVPRARKFPHGFASCKSCPEPAYSEEARAKRIEGIVLLVVTVTEQGTAEQISVVRGLPGGLTDSAVQTVRSWRFGPAVGPDGKSLATRTPIEVRFRLTN